jgi:hypothetical protein
VPAADSHAVVVTGARRIQTLVAGAISPGRESPALVAKNLRQLRASEATYGNPFGYKCSKAAMGGNMGWLLILAWVIFLFWRARRAREDAAERLASGELKSPLYWIYNSLALSVVVLIGYMAKVKPAEIGAWWLLVIALLITTLFVRRALCWRYPHA